MNADRERIEAIKAAWAEDRAARVVHWRTQWHIELLETLLEVGGGFVFGVALGMAAVVAGLVELSR